MYTPEPSFRPGEEDLAAAFFYTQAARYAAFSRAVSQKEVRIKLWSTK
jgi:phosphopantetheinyl transferase